MDKFKALLYANKITDGILSELKTYILENKEISTLAVADRTRELLRMFDIESAFLGYKGFPEVICISLNDEVVHGIPKATKIIRKGDIVSLDLGVIYHGYCSDMAISFVNASVLQYRERHKLVKATKNALDDAIKALTKEYPHCFISTIASSIEKSIKNYGIVRNYGGHEIGEQVHQGNLFIPNCWKGLQRDAQLTSGTAFTIEPMFTLGSAETYISEDGWTVKTKDGSLAAHFEYSIMVTEKGIEVLK